MQQLLGLGPPLLDCFVWIVWGRALECRVAGQDRRRPPRRTRVRFLAGSTADANVKLPRGVGTSSPEEVAKAVVSAIERNRREVIVAPATMRASTVFSNLAPELAIKVARMAGSDAITSAMEAGQRAKR